MSFLAHPKRRYSNWFYNIWRIFKKKLLKNKNGRSKNIKIENGILK